MVTSGTENSPMVRTGLGESRHAQRVVEVKTSGVVHAIMDIDNDRQEFSASLTIRCRWKEPALAGVLPYDHVNWDQQWTPGLELENAVGIKNMFNKYELCYAESDDRDTTPYVCQTMKVVATFKEFFELQEFPFDYQALNVWLTAERASSQMRFVGDPDAVDRIVTETFPEFNEWTLQPHVIGEALSLNKRAVDDDIYDPPYYTFTCHISRHHGYHIWSHALVMGLLLLLSFVTFALDPQSAAPRLVVSMLTLIASVAYRDSIRGELPRTSYWSWMAKYSLFAILLQALIVVENGAVGVSSRLLPAKTYAAATTSANTTTTAADALASLYAADYIMLALIFSGACFGHFFFIARATVALSRRTKFLKAEAREYQERCAKTRERQMKLKQTLTLRRRAAADSDPTMWTTSPRAALDLRTGTLLGTPRGLGTSTTTVPVSPRLTLDSWNRTAYGVEREMQKIARSTPDLQATLNGELSNAHRVQLTAVEQDSAGDDGINRRHHALGMLGYFRPQPPRLASNGRLSPIVGEDQAAENVSTSKTHTVRLSASSVPSPPDGSSKMKDRRQPKHHGSNRVGSSSGDNESRV